MRGVAVWLFGCVDFDKNPWSEDQGLGANRSMVFRSGCEVGVHVCIVSGPVKIPFWRVLGLINCIVAEIADATGPVGPLTTAFSTHKQHARVPNTKRDLSPRTPKNAPTCCACAAPKFAVDHHLCLQINREARRRSPCSSFSGFIA
jgi:hypothetical protein